MCRNARLAYLLPFSVMQSIDWNRFFRQYFMQNAAKVQLLKITPDAIFVGIITILERNSVQFEK
jgi:hypothetical protein